MNRIQWFLKQCQTKRMEISLAVGLLLAVFFAQQNSFARVCGQIRSDTLRLHIRAASDSSQDQADKLAVRDALIEESAQLFAEQTSREQAIETAQKNLDRLQKTAQDVLESRNSDNTATVYLTEMFFETIDYGDFTMPAGEYTALRVDIGTAEGKNWWCVLFPALCVPAAQDKTVYSQRETDVMQNGIEIRFALVELWEHLVQTKETYTGC